MNQLVSLPSQSMELYKEEGDIIHWEASWMLLAIQSEIWGLYHLTFQANEEVIFITSQEAPKHLQFIGNTKE
jgi:hypothetical protein